MRAVELGQDSEVETSTLGLVMLDTNPSPPAPRRGTSGPSLLVVGWEVPPGGC